MRPTGAAGAFFDIVLIPNCPIQTFADQPQSHIANGGVIRLIQSGGRCLINKEQVKVHAMNSYAFLRHAQKAGEQIKSGLAPQRLRQTVKKSGLRLQPKSGIVQ